MQKDKCQYCVASTYEQFCQMLTETAGTWEWEQAIEASLLLIESKESIKDMEIYLKGKYHMPLKSFVELYFNAIMRFINFEYQEIIASSCGLPAGVELYGLGQNFKHQKRKESQYDIFKND